jgi:predicted ATPase
MLTYLNLKNFKIWKSTGPIDLAPVTLLLGTNSSGKSSLIQSLLLIRQTVKSDDDNVDLNFGNPDGNDSVILGQFSDVLCQHAGEPKDMVEIEFNWRPTPDQQTVRVFSARYREGSSGAAEQAYLRLGANPHDFTVELQKQGVYRLLVGNEDGTRRQSVDYRPHRSFTFSHEVIARLGEQGKLIEDIGPQLLAELSKIIYLGPVRKLARRDYVWNGRMPATIGDDGSKAVDALIASGVEVQNATKKKVPSQDAVYLYESAAKWLKKMDLAEGLAVKSLGGSSRYELLIERKGEKTNLKDVGVGVSQVLPVIVAALCAAPGHIVIVEEPESHLHPLAQSVLAELFAEVSKERGVQFIVETHSEHLFRRMQTLMAKGQVRQGSDCRMYFVERSGPDASLRALETNGYGGITNWPDKFFGDTLTETSEQAQAMFRRQKAEQ